MKKALVLVQGINNKNYLVDEVGKSKFPIKEYDTIIFVPTEDIFDRTIPGFIKHIPIFNKFYDQYIADVRAFFRNTEARKQACKLVRNKIQSLQADGYLVDVLAHSLGTLITMCCGPQKGTKPVFISKFFCYNSPLGFGVFPGGMIVRSFVRKFMLNFITKDIEYIYSSNDKVSKDYKPSVIRIISALVITNRFRMDTKQDHSFSNNADERYSTILED